MIRWCLGALCAVLCAAASADSYRCRGKLVKAGESANVLIRKCGEPVRKYNARTVVTEHGKRQQVSVSNWVYERRGKRDMIASVRGGTVVRLQVDRD